VAVAASAMRAVMAARVSTPVSLSKCVSWKTYSADSSTPAKNESAAPAAANAHRAAMMPPTISACRPASPSPKPNLRPHMPSRKLPMPDAAIVSSRNAGVRTGFFEAGMRRCPQTAHPSLHEILLKWVP